MNNINEEKSNSVNIDNKDNKKKKNKKCFNCKKKLGLLKYSCKCDHTFCIVCVLPEDHKCQFNYVEEQKRKLEISLPKVINEKIQLI